VGDNVWNATSTDGQLADLEELVGGLLGGDAVDNEATLDIVEETEVLARLFDRDDVYSTKVEHISAAFNCSERTHVAGRVSVVGADLSVNLDQSLGDNRGDFTAVQGILEAVAEEDGEGQGFTELVGTGRGTGSLYV
jgi:hypothetical protein